MKIMMRVFWATTAFALLTGNAMAVEEAEYELLREDGDFSLRLYAAHIVAETTVDTDFEDAGGKAFSRLFDYISGENQPQQEVAMTSPVTQQSAGQKIAMTAPVGQQAQDGEWQVRFTMPASFTLETTPEPTDPAVTIRKVPARHMAAVRYSGFWSKEKYQRNLDALRSWMADNGLEAVGEPIWARYDPPFKPWFLRRNEVLVPVAAPQDSQ